MDIKQVDWKIFLRDTVYLILAGVTTYVFVYLLIADKPFMFKPGEITIALGLLTGLLGLVFGSRMYMEDVACEYC